jgi:predicted nicotinamide N-methyase
MRTMMWVLAVVAAANLSGCATTRSGASAVQSEGIDSQRVAAVEQTAKAYGVNVYWFNYPTAKLGYSARPVN